MPSESHPSVARAFVLAAIMSAASCGSAPSGPTPTAGPISAVTLTATLPAGALPEVRRGEMVTFTADARGGKLPLEFRFRGNGIVMRGWNTERRFTWNTTTDADGHLVGSGRIYFWVDARSSVGIETERSSDVIQFDVLDCAGFDQYTPLCQNRALTAHRIAGRYGGQRSVRDTVEAKPAEALVEREASAYARLCRADEGRQRHQDRCGQLIAAAVLQIIGMIVISRCGQGGALT